MVVQRAIRRESVRMSSSAFVQLSSCTVLKTTDRAVLIRYHSNGQRLTQWFPRSVLKEGRDVARGFAGSLHCGSAFHAERDARIDNPQSPPTTLSSQVRMKPTKSRPLTLDEANALLAESWAQCSTLGPCVSS